VDPDGEFALDVAEHLFYLLFHTVRRRDINFDKAIGHTGLTLARWRTLAIIRQLDRCTMKDLARFSAVDRTTLTRTADQLVDEALVSRSVPQSDRRQVLLQLTEEGERLYQRGVAILMPFNRDLLAGLGERRQREVARALQVILRNLAGDDADDLIAFARASAPP
jgi:DNA-binding MarR family transcriptional regulator